MCSRFTFESHGFTWALDMTGCTSDCSSTRMVLTFVPSDPPQARGIREAKDGCQGHALAPLGAARAVEYNRDTRCNIQSRKSIYAILNMIISVRMLSVM